MRNSGVVSDVEGCSFHPFRKVKQAFKAMVDPLDGPWQLFRKGFEVLQGPVFLWAAGRGVDEDGGSLGGWFDMDAGFRT